MGELIFVFIFISTVELSHGFVPFYRYYSDHVTQSNLRHDDSLTKLLGEKKSIPLMLIAAEESKDIAGNRKGILLDAADFQSLNEQNAPLVDKTNFITDYMTDAFAHVMITRPQGFGKTFSHSMLYHFLNIRENSTRLFNGTNITKDQNPDVCKAHQNQHPVIRISFGDLDSATTWEEAQNLFQSTFSKMLGDHHYLITEKPKINDISAEYRKNWFEQVINAKSLAFPSPTLIIHTLSRHLFNHFKKHVIILIDDYDLPLQAAYHNGYYAEMLGFYRPLLQSALRDNPFVNKSLILGISQISKEDILSGVNHLECYTAMKSRYSSYFGFNESEVAQLVGDYKLDARLIKKMGINYGGYRFGDLTLLNPYSVTQCLKHKGNLMSYWMDSTRKETFEKLMKSSGLIPVLQSDILQYDGVFVNYTCDEKLGYSSVKKDLNAFWTLVVDFGFVTIAKKELESRGRFKCQLRIPNDELFKVFHEFLNKYHADHKNILPYLEWINLVLARNGSGTLDFMKFYFDTALTYFAAEDVEDPLAQMETLASSLIQGLKIHYGKFMVQRTTGKPRDGYADVTISLRGGPNDIPLIFCLHYTNKFSWNVSTLLGCLRYNLYSPVLSFLANFRTGRVFNGSKGIGYVIFDSWILYKECSETRIGDKFGRGPTTYRIPT